MRGKWRSSISMTSTFRKDCALRSDVHSNTSVVGIFKQRNALITSSRIPRRPRSASRGYITARVWSFRPPSTPVSFRLYCRLQTRPYFLSVSRLVPYKRVDLLIAAANAKGLPLHIAGEGQDRRRLERLAGPTVRFLGRVPDEDLPGLYAGASAFLFPAFEDAGLVPMEAQACGTPVIAYGKGGVCDTVKDGATGITFHEQSLSSLLEAIGRFSAVSWDHRRIRAHARQFSAERFREKISEEVVRAVDFSHAPA